MSTKQLAESQFDKSAAPVSLGFQFNDMFEDYHFDIDQIDDVEEHHVYDPPKLISNDIDCINCDPRSLVLLANDLHPDKRDKEELKNSPPVESSPIDNQQPTVPDQQNTEFFVEETIDNSKDNQPQFKDNSVENVDFLIANKDFRNQHIEGQAKFGNQTVSAINLVLLAIEKFNSFEKEKLQLEKDTTLSKHNFSTMLICKSMSSVKFVNKIGFKIQSLIEQKNPNKFKKFKNDRSADISYLNNHVAKTRLEHLYHYSILAKYVTFSHIELNSCPANDLGLKHNHLMISCHSLLRYLNFSTIHPNSIAFKNIKNLVSNFQQRYKGKRLFYLEYLISEIEKGNAFFDSKNVNFFDRSENRWNNPVFPGINKWINQWWELIK